MGVEVSTLQALVRRRRLALTRTADRTPSPASAGFATYLLLLRPFSCGFARTYQPLPLTFTTMPRSALLGDDNRKGRSLGRAATREVAT